MKAQWMCLASAFWCASLSAQTYNGWTDGNGCSAITGWAWDSSQPNTPVNVDLIDSTTLSSIATVTANIFRQDLANAGIGNGYHGFSLPVPAYLKDNRTHVALGYISGTNIQLNNGNDSWYCSPDSTGYQYYYSDVFSTINTANWTQNGWGLTVNNGLADTDVNGGSLISKVAVPGNDYEVRATLN